MSLLRIILWICVLALVYVGFISKSVVKQSAWDAKMKKIARHISEWAMSFLKAEYKVLIFFVIIVAVILWFTADKQSSSPLIAIAFVIGSILSALAWFIGMKIATKANVRTTHAAKTSLSKALKISFNWWTVMGISVVSLGLIWLTTLFIVFQFLFNKEGMNGDALTRVLEILTWFSLGAESIALFARVGWGIFTKAADVGADLVGKLEAWIPEDDPRNPAVIADNVGDNVGDVAGMGADLFGSYVSTILATMVLGAVVSTTMTDSVGWLSLVLLPLIICTIWTIFSIIWWRFVKIKEKWSPQMALNIGNFGAIILTAIATFFAIRYLVPATFSIWDLALNQMSLFYTILVGLAVGTLMSLVTEFYCSQHKSPVRSIAKNSITWAWTNVISGLSVGMMSTALPVIILALGIALAFSIAWVYGVALAATWMMATTGIQLAIDAFGPIADNAWGIAEMAHLPKEVRERTDILDATGNTTAAIGKWFAIASAALTALALFAAFKRLAWIEIVDVSNANILAWVMIWGMIPFLFSSLAIRAVSKAAGDMVKEVRRQFKEIPGLLAWKKWVEADYDKCIQISTKAALSQMILPGALAILSPIIMGFIGGAEVLAGFLVGATVTWVLMAIFQSNAGWAWDNAKKLFEGGVTIDGQIHYKWSDSHKAAVVGDTVGDPLKDTSGPSINILLKLMAIVSLVIATMIK
ncbi:MAG: hypothetical protein ACD_80C00013G0008 [uncultured bacterium (gcode 4)]|uniref:Putative K(+)-stimulated pyrophosphate-energized sodium pump n=1 Tax=uncultured bacterium (gcode 4) TaxID=1234023 RepID=K1XZ25_9BACT|nr:MAG: hypothetical protein ACD_80C00013G0008 [uncultured bacterium (gcode 4)]